MLDRNTTVGSSSGTSLLVVTQAELGKDIAQDQDKS